MDHFLFTVQTVAPVFLIVLIGFLLKRKSIINDNFIQVASQIVFRVTLPALVFSQIAVTDYSKVLNLRQIGFAVIGILFFFAVAWVLSLLICYNGRDRGAFIQGSFRSNFSILGFALILNAFGQTALANAAILLAVIMPLLNILSVIALAVPQHKEKQINLMQTMLEIAKNPLILAALAAIPFSYFRIAIHPVFMGTIKYLAAMTLPLALLGIGGSLSVSSVQQELKLSIWAGFIKIILMPSVLVIAAISVGFLGSELGVLFFLFGTPTAIASYIMAEAMDSNSRLAANIILVTTLGSIITLSAGLYLLKSMGYF